MTQVMTDATLWGRYLWVSGGFLEFMKTMYCLMIWSFDEMGTPRLLHEEELPENIIQIEAANGTKTKMRRQDVNEGAKMLGVRQAATLQMNTEYQHQAAKTHKFASAITACPLQRQE